MYSIHTMFKNKAITIRAPKKLCRRAPENVATALHTHTHRRMFSSECGEVEVAAIPSPLCAHVMPENGSNKSFALDHCEVEVPALARKISRLNLYFFFNGQRAKSTKKKKPICILCLFYCSSLRQPITPTPPLPSPTPSALSPHLQTSTVLALVAVVVVVRLVGLVLLFNQQQQQQHANNLCTRPLLSWIICLA